MLPDIDDKNEQRQKCAIYMGMGINGQSNSEGQRPSTIDSFERTHTHTLNPIVSN